MIVWNLPDASQAVTNLAPHLMTELVEHDYEHDRDADGNVIASRIVATRVTATSAQRQAAHADALLAAGLMPAGSTYDIAEAMPAALAAQIAKAADNAAAQARLVDIDLKSVRALREYIAAKADAPKIIKDREAEAVAERAKLKA